MNKTDIEDFKELKKLVEDNTETLKNISVCLMGDPKDHKSEGLVGAVNNNVKWKNNVNKALAVFIPLSVGVAVKTIYAWIMGTK